jgi:hypothetical protein
MHNIVKVGRERAICSQYRRGSRELFMLHKNQILIFAMLSCTQWLSGCDAFNTENTGVSPSTANTRVAATQSDKALQNMVTAFSVAEGQVPLDVKFEIKQRPEVDKPTDIVLALIPKAGLERVQARISAGEGLELLKGSETAQFTRPAAGVPLMHDLSVLAKKDGIFYVRVTIILDSPSESVSRIYTVPLIAGSGITEPQTPEPSKSS